MADLIDRQVVNDVFVKLQQACFANGHLDEWFFLVQVAKEVNEIPSAKPKQRYTEEELSVFAHGISLSLLSKRSAQHWRYDKDTATEIEFLERLYDKVSADMKGGQG